MTHYVANEGQPCRFCDCRPFYLSQADVDNLRAYLSAEYHGCTSQEVADACDVCVPCSGAPHAQYTVVDPSSLGALGYHGDFATLEEARSCVAFDHLTFWQIWLGDDLIEEGWHNQKEG